MKEGAERIQPESNEPRKPEARESAEVVYINDFAAYSALPGGHLKREEFERIKNAATEADTKVNEVYAINAKTYAGQAEITLSPESLKLYSILRSDNDISSDLLRGDQQILAEVLRIEGRVADAEKLIAAYPVITF
jgi:hypothetical protein